MIKVTVTFRDYYIFRDDLSYGMGFARRRQFDIAHFQGCIIFFLLLVRIAVVDYVFTTDWKDWRVEISLGSHGGRRGHFEIYRNPSGFVAFGEDCDCNGEGFD